MRSLYISMLSFGATWGVFEFLFKLVQDLLSDALREWAKKFPLSARLLILAVAFVVYVLVVKSYIDSILGASPPFKDVPISPWDNKPIPQPNPPIPIPVPVPAPAPAPVPAPVPAPPVPQKPRIAVRLDSALTPYKKDIESILSTLPLRNGTSIDISMSMETPETPDMPGAEPATISVIVDATATFKSSNGSPLKTMLLPQYKVTQIQKNIPNTDTYIRDRVKSAARGFAKSILEGL